MIRAAIVGLGWWGKTIARELAGSQFIRPVVGVDPDERSRAGAAELGLPLTARFEDALERVDVEAVILCSPHKFHADQIIAATGAGKHVFCEKPLCTTTADGLRALAAVKEAGVTLGIGHERRFEPAVIAMREALERGDYGTPLLMEANFSQDKFFALPRTTGDCRRWKPRSGPFRRRASIWSISPSPSSVAPSRYGRGSRPAAAASPTGTRYR